jgi:hypothetical protein
MEEGLALSADLRHGFRFRTALFMADCAVPLMFLTFLLLSRATLMTASSRLAFFFYHVFLDANHCRQRGMLRAHMVLS